MLTAWTYAIASTIGISLFSLIGILIYSVKAKQLKKVLIYMVSFSTGALLGDVFIHLLPEAVEEYGFGLNVSLYILLGVIFSFIIEKFVHWHHCHSPEELDCPHPFAVMNLVGDGVHNFIDGMIIGASYLVSIPVGIATTIAVLLHEIPQEIADFGILLHGGFSRKKALFFNFIIALIAVLGTLLVFAINAWTDNLLAFFIPFAAGGFVYIAGADLIPELHKEVAVSKSLLQLLSIVLGILVMLGLRIVGI